MPQFPVLCSHDCKVEEVSSFSLKARKSFYYPCPLDTNQTQSWITQAYSSKYHTWFWIITTHFLGLREKLHFPGDSYYYYYICNSGFCPSNFFLFFFPCTHSSIIFSLGVLKITSTLNFLLSLWTASMNTRLISNCLLDTTIRKFNMSISNLSLQLFYLPILVNSNLFFQWSHWFLSYSTTVHLEIVLTLPLK